MIRGRKLVKKMEVTVGGKRIESKRAIKYLGVIIDDKLNFKEYVKYIGKKASVTQAALARMMPNIGGPGPFERRIISVVVTSIMLYACSIWPEALSVWTTRRILSSVYRLNAIRRINGFRTVSDEAVLVLAKAMPIDILADEMRRIYIRRLECPERMGTIRVEERRTSMQLKANMNISPCPLFNPERTL